MNLNRLFHPRSVAVVGASPRLGSGKLPYYQLLKHIGYEGNLYAVHPHHKEIDGDPIFPSLTAISEPIDLAIMVVPAKAALSAARDAVEKHVGFIHFFTSGFSEVGNRELETELLNLISGSDTHVVGPNCLGVMCSASRITFSPHAEIREQGKVAFLGQSGGLCENFVSLANSRGIAINKAVSFGNQIDVKIEDYLSYFGEDEQISVIGAYIEDVKNARRFREVLQGLAGRKPVVVLKGGATESGARAAASHTGAMAGAHRIFSALLRQTGCIEVDTLERLVDVVMLAASEKPPAGGRTGYVVGGGGASVVSTDIAARYGLNFPELQPETRRRIGAQIMDVNTSTANPVDLGAFAFNPNIMLNTIAQLGRDEALDLIIPQFTVGSAFLKPKYEPEAVNRLVAELDKPLLPVVSRMSDNNISHEEYRINLVTIFRKAGLPVFNSMAEAGFAIRKLLDWKTRSESGA